MTSRNKFSRPVSWFLTKPKTSGILVTLLLTVIVAFIVLQRYQIVKENEERDMYNILNVVHQNIEQSLKNCYTTTLTLALTINDKGQPENFDYIGAQLLESNNSISAVQLVPNGVITFTYPLQGNEGAIGYDILNSPKHREDALKSIRKQKMYFAGPMELRQGGTGIVGRLPVYQQNKFWGFSAVIIKLETLLKTSGINTVDETKYYFQFSKKDNQKKKEVFFLPNTGDFSEKYHVSASIPDGDWELYLISKDKFGLYYQVLPIAVLGLVLALLFGILITTLLERPAELQQLLRNQATELLNSETKFKTIFDHAAVGIAHLDSNSGQFIEVNRKYGDLLGYSEDEMKERTFQSITHPEDLAEDLEKMEELKQGKIRGFSMEKRYYTKAGGIIWAHLTVSPLWDIGEKPTTHIAIVEDITQKKEADTIILKSEARFKSLFDDSPVALWEEDYSEVKTYLAGLHLIGQKPKAVLTYFNMNPNVVNHCISLVKIIDVNNECLKMHSPKTKQELLSANLNGLMVDEDSRRSFIKQLIAVTSESNLIAMDTKITRDDNSRDIYLRWSVMRGYEETLERVIISTEDITARKEAEKLISDSQLKIASLINTVDGIVWECDFDSYEFTFVNKKAEEITGYPVSEWLHDAEFWARTIHPEDREWAISLCAANAVEKKQYSFEYRMIAKDGSILWIRDIVNVIYEGSKPVSLRGIMIDITKTKEAEKDLNNSFELVSEQNKRLLNFSYIVSHNLRSHTSNIQSITTLIESAETDDERHHLVQMLKTVSDSLNETMLNLNEVVNIQSNMSLSIETLNLSHYIEATLNIVSEQIAAKNVTVINTVGSDVNVSYNPAYLESILLNLISNAIRYSHPQRQPVLSIEWITENDRKILKVSDNGIGIDLKRHGDKIFGMYKTFSNNPDAKGIGLFITKNQIDAMGGTISVESELNSGTSFKIAFK